MAKANNKDVLQSYIITTAKYDFSVYEKRILYRIIETNQKYLKGLELNSKYQINKNLFGDRIYTMPVVGLLKGEEDKNYAQIKKALTSLRNKTIEYEDEKTWRVIGIIEKPVFDKYSSVLTFELQDVVYDALMDFSKGFRKYELETAMNFESVYSMRFYELFSGKKQPIKYTLETLKEMFGIKDKYKKINDFLRYVILPAQKELNAKSPYTFTFEPYKQGRKIVGFVFSPVFQPQHRDSDLIKKELQKQTSPAWDLERNTIQYLEQNFEFTKEEIKRNMELFKTAQNKIDDFVLWLSKKRRTANDKTNPKGYLINAIKGELNKPKR